jgi:hypothetical protein
MVSFVLASARTVENLVDVLRVLPLTAKPRNDTEPLHRILTISLDQEAIDYFLEKGELVCHKTPAETIRLVRETGIVDSRDAIFLGER